MGLIIFTVVMSTLAVSGFVSGAARRSFGNAPWIYLGTIAVGYIALLVMAGAHAASCSSCASSFIGDSARSVEVWVALYGGAALAFGLAVCVGLGIVAESLLHAFRR